MDGKRSNGSDGSGGVGWGGVKRKESARGGENE